MATSGSEGSKTSLFGAVRRDVDLVCAWGACVCPPIPPKELMSPPGITVMTIIALTTEIPSTGPRPALFCASQQLTVELGEGAPGLNTGSHINMGKWLTLHNSVSSSFTYE